MNMKKVLLGETCEILDSQRVPITSTERKSGIYPYYGANGLQDYVDGYLFDDELVLLAEDGGNFGSKDRPIAYRVSGKCWVNNHAHVLKPKTPYDVDYICYALMFYDTTGLVNGATRQKLTQSAMRQMQIPYRSWDEQKVIVSKINAVIELIEARKEQTNYLDDLVKSRFIEMFGEPNHGDKFEKASGKDLFVFSSGKFLPEDKRKSEGVAVYGGNGIAWYTTEPLITHETIVIGRVGAYCGNVRYVKEPIWITDNAIYIKAFKKNCFSIVYLYELMKMLNFYQFADFSGQPKITQKPLETMLYAVPPIELQEQFSTFVEQVDKSKFEIQQSLETLEILKKSLLQKYFG